MRADKGSLEKTLEETRKSLSEANEALDKSRENEKNACESLKKLLESKKTKEYEAKRKWLNAGETEKKDERN